MMLLTVFARLAVVERKKDLWEGVCISLFLTTRVGHPNFLYEFHRWLTVTLVVFL